MTYTIKKYEDNSESESNSEIDEENEEEENESQINKNENNLRDSKVKNLINSDNNEENKIKVYIYGNRDPCVFNKYYIQNSIGYIYFGIKENIEQNFIYENDIKITIEDLEDFNE